MAYKPIEPQTYFQIDCKTVRIHCIFKYARAVKQKVWNEAETESGRVRLARVRHIRPRFTDFFTDFEEKPDCFAV